MPRLVALAWITLLALGCGDDGAPVDGDAGEDAGADAAGFDAGSDAGPMCEPSCGAGLLCCPAEGGAECVDWNNDARNCGECGADCVAEERGTHCASGSCVCGSNPLGCAFGGVCCPPRPGTSNPYCARFLTDSRDCGGCDQQCEPERADRCDGGRCLCGEGSRRQCDGTAADTCCADVVGNSECVDTTSDRRHCGGCGISCDTGLRCEAGECVGT